MVVCGTDFLFRWILKLKYAADTWKHRGTKVLYLCLCSSVVPTRLFLPFLVFVFAFLGFVLAFLGVCVCLLGVCVCVRASADLRVGTFDQYLSMYCRPVSHTRSHWWL